MLVLGLGIYQEVTGYLNSDSTGSQKANKKFVFPGLGACLLITIILEILLVVVVTEIVNLQRAEKPSLPFKKGKNQD